MSPRTRELAWFQALPTWAATIDRTEPSVFWLDLPSNDAEAPEPDWTRAITCYTGELR